MNARSQVIQLTVEGRQIEEVVLGLFHTILLNRTTGKHNYTKDRNFTIGSLAVQDIDCDFLDFTYVKIVSKELDAYLKKEVSQFRDMLRHSEGQQSGQIMLEFYRKQRNRWLFQGDVFPWEVWSLKLDIINLSTENERSEFKEKLSHQVMDKVFYILDVINRHEYVPSTPPKEDEELVYDTSFTDIQPYLFRISQQTTGPSPTSVGTTMRKFLRGSLAL
ncbi:autophagy-related protein 101-like [Biomphalaria glabrata]|uniref:Autophagy-related protein 101 n=2 Tax=Biomphalaria TaxID=6525 RepID=A0A9W3BN13_BIOGL|nr:autophagy-related protein 101-like [Biomphalaria glabrata]KAI8760641.1 autophagy-related protein 101-like [Biomphalaria glabrata]KAK0068523.1 autophagy-related protein 101 [Biomphalaria pfeifferi]